MSKQKINTEKNVEVLLNQLKSDYLSTYGKEYVDSRPIDSVPIESLIWNLFRSKKYNFSYQTFKLLLNKLIQKSWTKIKRN